MRKILVLLVLFFSVTCTVKAAYLTNVPMTLIQPNGDTLHCFATGDEFYHWLHDAQGYTIVKDVHTGYFVYALKDGDNLIPSSFIAGEVDPQTLGISPGLNISAQQKMLKRKSFLENIEKPNASLTKSAKNNEGVFNNLVVFIRLADASSTFVNGFSTIESMFNNETAGANSVINYYRSASYNKLTISSSFYPSPNGDVIVSYQDTHNRNYYLKYSEDNPDGYDGEDERMEREHALLVNACNYIESMVPQDLDIDFNDDGYVDNICFVVNGQVGGWSELLWPHRWSLYSQEVEINGKIVWDYNFMLEGASSYFTTSTVCHEMFHTLGAPDLYHYESDYNYLNSVYTWDLMHQNTNPPQHSGAYMKYKYGGWIDDIPEITQCGTYSLKSVGSSETNNCYKIASPNTDEFYILEYRHKTDLFEGKLPTSGLLIYRINPNFYGNSDYNGVDLLDEVYIFRPDGTNSVDGTITEAAFSLDNERTDFNPETNPFPFLSDGTLDNFFISDVSAIGDSITFRYCNNCFDPQNVTINTDYSGDYSDGSFIISWNTIDDVSSYNVYEGDELLGSTSDTLLRLYYPSGLPPYDQSVCFTITSNCDLGESDGVTVCGIIYKPDSCYIPVNLSASVDSTQIQLSWSPSYNAVSYNIYRDSELIASNVSDTFYLDNDLDFEMEYCYKVLSVCADGSSDFSAELCKTTMSRVCFVPDNLQAVATDNSIALSWDHSQNADTYTLYRDGEQIAIVSTNSYVDENLLYNTEYCYQVSASCESGESEATAAECASTGDLFCDTVSNVNTSILGDCIRITWTANENALSYDIYRNDVKIVDGNTATFYTDNTVDLSAPTFSYCYDVVSKCAENIFSQHTSQVCEVLTEIVSVDQFEGLSVYPNPAKTKLNIECEVEIEYVEIYSASGVKVLSEQISANQKSFEVSSFAEGLYYLRVKTAEGISVKMFSVK